MSTGAFLSCDWGTSAFRIRWVEGGEVRRQYRAETGCKTLFDRALASGQVSRAALYSECLRQVLATWPPAGQPLPLVISGMASSTIGWTELPYASVPLLLDGSNLRFETLSWARPDWVSETYLISGLATANEIMRGEETEAIGLLGQIPVPESAVLVLPGTHSKHLRVQRGRITDFTTHMTGELFDVLIRHSILKATTDPASLPDPDDDAFAAGVRQAGEMGLSSSIFRARTRAVLQGCPARENTWFLSGVLVGGELGSLPATGLVLIGGAPELRRLYERALDVLGRKPSDRRTFSDEQVAAAVPRAHALFLAQRRA